MLKEPKIQPIPKSFLIVKLLMKKEPFLKDSFLYLSKN